MTDRPAEVFGHPVTAHPHADATPFVRRGRRRGPGEMMGLPTMPVRFCPSKETLAVLNGRAWVANFSGGKDSTALVTWVEWLRRTNLVRCDHPRLVMSDTTVEYPFLQDIAGRLMAALRACGWECRVVTPRVNERLYNRIFGIGNTPVHPGERKMRWCTRATKIDPMGRYSRTVGIDVVRLSGVRWGESDTRDAKLSAGGCAAGGECGLPEPGEGVYAPIITWKTCKVVEWLGGEAGDILADLLPMMQELVGIYEVRQDRPGLFGLPARVTALRFGCVGCPAITREKVTNSRQGKLHPKWVHLRRIYGIWEQLYRRKNRCVRVKEGRIGYGPLRMATRQTYFAELLDIQDAAGVILVTPEDEAFIRDCWQRKVYPRGWSEADEAVVAPDGGLFQEGEQ